MTMTARVSNNEILSVDHNISGWLAKLTATKADLAPVLARVALGAVIFPHGAQKVLGWFGGYGIEGTMGFMTGKLGIPAPFALLAITAEFLGAIGLITGTLSRVAAFGIAMTMLVAAFMVHAGNGFFMNWSGAQAGEGFEYHILAIALAAIVMVKGAGQWSVDQKLAQKLTTKG
jgi:putative oxidoreductase